MEKPLISIITPVYNAEKYIGDTIESVLNQTYPYFEIILVDDASTDNSVEVIRFFKDERIHLIVHDKNRGPGAARNTAIEAAQGDWMAILDADDQWLPERLEKLVEVALEAGDNYFISDDILLAVETRDGLKIWKSVWKEYHKFKWKGSFADLDLLAYANMNFIGIKPLIPLRRIKKLNIRFPEDIFNGEDLYFIVRLFKSGLKLRLLCEPMYIYRITPGSLTSRQDKFDDRIKVHQRLLMEENFTDKEKAMFEKGIKKNKIEKEYYTFINFLKQKKIKKALLYSAKRPMLIITLLQRFPLALYYRVTWRLRGWKQR